MANDWKGLISRFRDLRILVIGDSMLDRYVEGSCRRFCPEAPVPIVNVGCQRVRAGGAANTALNARSLGATVDFLSVIGNDDAGIQLARLLRTCGISNGQLLLERGRRTLVKERVLAGPQLLLRLDHGGGAPMQPSTQQRLLRALCGRFPLCDALIVSDYGYGVLTSETIQTIARLQARRPRVIVVDSKNLADFQAIGPTAVKPNYEQTLQLVNGSSVPGSRLEQICSSGNQVLELSGAQIAAITLDADGALIFERDRPPYRTFARPAGPTAGTAGAGDTFTSTLALALACGAEATVAADLASAAAGVVVQQSGTAHCSAEELCRALDAEQKAASDLGALQAQVDNYRRAGRRIVLTNGCFDILHRGHVTYLAQARALGDVLIVGINSDRSIHRLKGPGRPLNSLEDRVHVLAALASVDHLIAFDEDTPHNLIHAIRPDVFVKGGDYTRERLPEASLVEELGGRVHILPLLENRSTSTLLSRIRSSREQDNDELSASAAGHGPRSEPDASLVGSPRQGVVS